MCEEEDLRKGMRWENRTLRGEREVKRKYGLKGSCAGRTHGFRAFDWDLYRPKPMFSAVYSFLDK